MIYPIPTIPHVSIIAAVALILILILILFPVILSSILVVLSSLLFIFAPPHRIAPRNRVMAFPVALL